MYKDKFIGLRGKFFAFVFWILTVGVSAWLFIYVSRECIARPQLYGPDAFSERVVYCIWAFGYLGLFRSAAGKRKSRIYILIRAGIVSFAYTVQIFLVNNFWRYLCFNSFFGWERKVDYLYFTVKDITYAVGWGKYRYPFTLAAMFSICIAGTAFIPKLRKAVCRFYGFKEGNLEEYVRSYVYGDSYSEMIEYLEKMPECTQTKAEIADCILSFDIPVLYVFLFEKCGELLSENEYREFRRRFVSVFGFPLPEVCRDLDDKYEITDNNVSYRHESGLPDRNNEKE